jgi:hypothetical protein
MLETIDDRLADVRGGFGTLKPTNFFVFENPPRLNNAIGKDITFEQRQRNDLLKQKLKDERWIRHKDTPTWERYEGTGFAVPM